MHNGVKYTWGNTWGTGAGCTRHECNLRNSERRKESAPVLSRAKSGCERRLHLRAESSSFWTATPSFERALHGGAKARGGSAPLALGLWLEPGGRGGRWLSLAR